MSSEIQSHSREELYEQVRSEPMRKLAKRYSISDVALAKICKKLDIPRPPRGYWARKEAGKKVKQTPLPPLRQGVPSEYRARGVYNSAEDSAAIGDEARQLLAREDALPTPIAVPDEIAVPHSLIRKYGGALRRAGKKLDGLKYEQACLDI
jgi:hypothetical protein